MINNENENTLTRITKLFRPHDNFLESTKNFKKVDVYLSYALFLFIFFSLWLITENAAFFVESNQRGEIVILMTIMIGIFPTIMSIALVFVFCKIRKQSIMRAGFNRSLALKSLFAGFMLGALHLVLIRGRFAGVRDDLMVHTFFIALFVQLTLVFMEELVFRAYITPRFFWSI